MIPDVPTTAELGLDLLGVAMRWLDVPVLPLLPALVLGGRLEEYLRMALTGLYGTSEVLPIFYRCIHERS